MERKFVLEVERLIDGTKVTLRRHEVEGEEIAETVKMLNTELDKVGTASQLPNMTSISPPVNLPLGLTPTPQLSNGVPNLPTLLNPPHAYGPTAAVEEILNPLNSVWAREPRTVKEIQQRLMDVGVRGVSNIQNFDAVIRKMLKAGTVKREKIDNVYKYYFHHGGA